MRRQVLLLRGLAILAVVANHATGWAFVAMFWWTHRYIDVVTPDYRLMASPNYWLLSLVNQTALFSVPAFLFISGLSAGYSTSTGPMTDDWPVLRARLTSLVGPYALWTLVVFGIDAALGTVLAPGDYLLRLLTGRATEAFYFVPLLVQFYLLSPLLVRGARKHPRAMLATAVAVQALVLLYPYVRTLVLPTTGPWPTLRWSGWTILRWPVYYVLGTVLATHPRPAARLLNRYRGALLAVAITLVPLMLAESQALWRAVGDWDWSHGSFRISSTLFAVAFILSALTWRIPVSSLTGALSRVGAMSYGIYLMHPKVLEVGARGVYHLAPWLLAHPLGLTVVLIVLPLAGCFLVMSAFARTRARRVYHYVFG